MDFNNTDGENISLNPPHPLPDHVTRLSLKRKRDDDTVGDGQQESELLDNIEQERPRQKLR
jgi:hypothetical protein